MKLRKWLSAATLIFVTVLREVVRAESDSDNLVENEEEPFFAEPSRNLTVSQGREAQLSCVVDNLGSYRPAWIKVESKAILTIHNHVITRNYRITLSFSDNRNFVLHIKNVQESDRGWYMCQVNTVPMISQLSYLDVQVPPDFIVEESKSDIVAREGTDITLKCRSKGYPKPNISWRREDNEPIPLGYWQKKKRLTTAYSGETLNITRVSRLHMGAYLCIASNGVPPSVSRRILLHVQFPPVMWLPHQLVGAQLGKNVTIDCHIEAYPAATNYWLNGNDVFISAGEKFQTTATGDGYKMHSKLTIRNLLKNDYGIYKCFAKNALGATESSVRLYEIPPLSKEGLSKENRELWKKNYDDLSAFPRHQGLGFSKGASQDASSGDVVGLSTYSSGCLWSQITVLWTSVWLTKWRYC